MIRAFVLALIGSLAIAGCQQESVQEDSNQGAVASLERPAPVINGIDQNGNAFRSTQLHGSYWLASFMFTTCQTVCPALNTIQSELAATYGPRGLRFVSISTDPDNDTPAALSAYAERYKAKTGTWWMLNMPIDTVISVATRGFAVMAPEHPDMHSTRFVLVDAQQQILDYFDSADTTEIRRLRETLDRLLATK